MEKTPAAAPVWWQRHVVWIVCAIMVVGGALRFFRLNDPPSFYFDEVYHAYTATRYVAGDRRAYDPWASPPPGVAFEWTHPPLAKLFMSYSLAVFGETSWAWRLPSALFGTLSIGLTAWIAHRLFHNARLTILAAFLLSIETLHFAMSRIGMNDMSFLFFFLGSLGSYWHWKNTTTVRWRWLLLSSIALGLALASKWTAIYGVLIIGVDQLATWWKNKKLPTLIELMTMTATYALVPFIYLGSYYQYFLQFNYKWSDFITLQQQMWWYHTKLSATHAYQSRPWQWLLNLRPVWMYVDYNVPNHIRNIYNIGNSIILWSGLVTMAELLWRVWKKFNASQFFVLIAYILVWVPWLFSPRIMFFYHYLPALPFLIIGLAWALDRGLARRPDSWFYWLAWTILIGSVVWFIFFYPQVSAWPIPLNLSQEMYYPIPSWK